MTWAFRWYRRISDSIPAGTAISRRGLSRSLMSYSTTSEEKPFPLAREYDLPFPTVRGLHSSPVLSLRAFWYESIIKGSLWAYREWCAHVEENQSLTALVGLSEWSLGSSGHPRLPEMLNLHYEFGRAQCCTLNQTWTSDITKCCRPCDKPPWLYTLSSTIQPTLQIGTELKM